jgi:hypothetical protein
MKKYFSIILVFVFVFVFGFEINSTQAASLPAGCTSFQGYSALTGIKCNSVANIISLPEGCTSTSGHSSTSGMKCNTFYFTEYPPECVASDGHTIKNNLTCRSAHLPYGCTSTLGYSTRNGARCDTSTYSYLPGCFSFKGVSYITGQSCSVLNHQTPIITKINAPHRLRVRKAGTWEVSAYDPLGGSLVYEIMWGDGKFTQVRGTTRSFLEQQYVTFSHSYSQVGEYAPIFTIRNFDGYSVEKSFNLEVN